MFLKTDDSGLQYLTCGTLKPDKYSALNYSSPPYFGQSEKSGTQVVVNYMNSLVHKYKESAILSQTMINTIYQKAIELDSQDPLIDADCDVPSLKSLMQAVLDLSYITNAKIGYINNRDTIKNYIRNYGCVIVELKFFSCIYNANDVSINQKGTEVSEDISKGFVAFGYDSTGIFVQNTRGVKCGTLGFHRIEWSLFDQLLIKGAVFIDN